MADDILQFESTSGFSGANLFVSGGATFTSVVSMSGGLSASGGITLNGEVTGATATFNRLTTLSGGISAAGGITFGATAAFRSSISLQNSEFIRNTTDGRMDFMPAPSSSTAYGVYLDFTSWTFGPRFGTIKSSDNTTNTAGILWDTTLTIGNDVDFCFGANQAYKFRTTAINNSYKTMQLGLPAGTVGYSSALALIDYANQGSSLRVPNTVHANPNLYLYSAGAANANDFMRMEHDRATGRIASGGTSGISVEPGNGVLGISGGISASGGATFAGTISLNGQAFTNVVSSVNGLTGGLASISAPAGLTLGHAIFTWPNGVTAYSASSTPYYTSAYWTSRSVSTTTLTTNRTYFVLHQAPRAISLKNIRVAANSPSVSMNLYLSVWSVNPLTGLPASRLYVSEGLTANASTFNYVTVTNASGLVSVPAGPFYMAITVGNSLPTYTHSNDRAINLYGSDNYVTGYQNYAPVLDTNGFTAPSSITQAGTTFAFVNYISAVVPTPVIEWNHI